MIYMPTWRDSNPNFILNSGWHFTALNEVLKKRNILLLMKLHVNTPHKTLHQATNQSNIHLMQPTEDAYSVLPFTSGLITDYSSILFDYLLLDKPICYYPFDRDKYESDSRGFYHSYESCWAGRQIKLPMEVADLNLVEDGETYSPSREKLRNNYFNHFDGMSAERIVRKIKLQ
ncbi:CDP-glycerol glycerophosphotransferase family protein [Limnohabitans sp.]